jgi:hypothetical protein
MSHKQTFALDISLKWSVKILSSQGNSFLKLRVYKVRAVQQFFPRELEEESAAACCFKNWWPMNFLVQNSFFFLMRHDYIKLKCEQSLVFRKCQYSLWSSLHDLIIGVRCSGNCRACVFQRQNKFILYFRLLATPFFWKLNEEEKFTVTSRRSMQRPTQQTFQWLP